MADRRAPTPLERQTRWGRLIAGGIVLLFAAAGGWLWLRHPDVITGLFATGETAEDPVAVDPELQAMVDGWRDEDAAPSEWHLAQLERLRHHHDVHRRRLAALEADYTRHAQLARSASDRAIRDRARMDADLAARQAAPLRSEVQRTAKRIAAMEQRLGLRPSTP